MSYEFNGTLFQTRATMCDAIAQEWMTAGGRNHRDEIDAACEMGATALATECIRGWGLDQADETDGPTWMEQRECTRDDIVAAFERFIADRPDTAVTVGN